MSGETSIERGLERTDPAIKPPEATEVTVSRGPGGEPAVSEEVDTPNGTAAVSGLTQLPAANSEPTYLSAQESVTWVKQSLLAQVPASVRVPMSSNYH